MKRPWCIGVSAGALLGSVAAFSVRAEEQNGVRLEPSDNKKAPFDVTQDWTNGTDFLKNLIFTNEEKEEDPPNLVENIFDWAKHQLTTTDQNDDDKTANESSTGESFLSTVQGFAGILTGTDETKGQAMQHLIQRATTSTRRVKEGHIRDNQSYNEILTMMRQDLSVVTKSLEGSVGHIDLSQIFPTSVFYYLEAQDEIKNPSWKRRMHRFCQGIDVDEVNSLNDALYLAELAYETSVDTIKAGIEHCNDPLELVYCSTDGEPCRPAHYIALKKHQSMWSSSLEVVMVVRGTSSMTDAMTDCMCEPVDYRGGKAHYGILDSGKFLVDQHLELLENLRTLSGKRTLKLTLIGHSLGAGAAAIAGMELKEEHDMDVKVIGFGCPALLSEDLSKAVSNYMTTVIDDSDVVPRMSGATIGNLLLDIQEYNYIPKSRRDIVQAFDELEAVSPGILPEGFVKGIMTTVDSLFEKYVYPTIKPATTERSEPILFPPGKCVHFYRDGYGVTGSVTPCTFFREIDLTRRMIDDHLITSGYRQIFLELMRQYKNDQHFSFHDGGENEHTE